ncbi:metallopeptidase family protein, partial [Acinetobacter baumannii]
PDPLRAKVAEVAIHVVDFPDDATLSEMDMDSPWDLTGLYRGVPLTERSVAGDHGRLPDTVHLYRQPILAEWCESGETL